MKRVAVIGLGSIAERHRQNLKIIFPQTEVFSLSASGRLPSEKVNHCDQLVTDLHELIAAKVEFVIVASPAPYHAKHALPLISAGIPILIEKPVATETSDIFRLISAGNKYATPAAVGYCLRYQSSAKKMHQLLEAKTIGRVYNAFIEVGQYLPDWRPRKSYLDTVSASSALGGGALFELSHELDYARWLLGELTVHAAILRSSDELKLELEDSVDLLAMTKRRAVVSIHLDFLQRAPHRRCRITGTEGALEWDILDNSIYYRDKEHSKVLWEDPTWDRNNMYLDMTRDFIAQIRGEKHNCVSVEDAGKTLSLINQIREVAELEFMIE